MRKRVCLLILLFSASTFNPSWAYDLTVHREITKNAADAKISSLDYILKAHLGVLEGITAEITKGKERMEIREWIAFGSEAEDYGYLGKNNFLTTRAYNHFHDPLRDWDEAGLDDAAFKLLYWGSYFKFPVSPILWAFNPGQQDFFLNRTGDWSWGKAREYYHTYLTGRDFAGNIVAITDDARKGNLASCLRALGQVIHLLQDMSVPLHTRNDVHVFPLVRINKGYPFQRWTYETYTKENIERLDFIPDQSGHRPDRILINDAQPQASPQDYRYLPPITGLFDRNQYDGSQIPLNNSVIGLAEYSNANFLTQDTIWTYPHPGLDDTNYDTVDWLDPERIAAEDGKTDNRIYLKKVVGERIEHLVAVDYWSFEYWGFVDSIPVPFSLDERCWKDYADKLVPRAVGYSAALLDYFFCGTLEISGPDAFLYSIIDGSVLPQEFTYIKAKVRNTTPKETNEQGEVISYEEMGPGTLVAVARYRKRIDYKPDLSTDPPTAGSREAAFSYSVSLPINIESLDSENATEFFFDFRYAKIPAGITDLYLQVVFKGGLGNEMDNAIAVGMKDLNEPMHVVSWNSTDMFYLDGRLYTPEQIQGDGDLLKLIPPGFNIDPYDALQTGLAFYLEDFPQHYNAYAQLLPSGTLSRIILLADRLSFRVYGSYYSISPFKQTYFEDETVVGVINQENEGGEFKAAPVYSFRGERGHLLYALWNFFPDNEGILSAPWPPPASPYPVPTDIYP